MRYLLLCAVVALLPSQLQAQAKTKAAPGTPWSIACAVEIGREFGFTTSAPAGDIVRLSRLIDQRKADQVTVMLVPGLRQVMVAAVTDDRGKHTKPRKELVSESESILDRCTETAESRVARLRGMDWPAEMIDAVIAEEVAIGMTADMVREAWGYPDDINRTTTAAGTDEQWVYYSAYVYIENGAVVAIQS